MGYLLDTVVLSATAPNRTAASDPGKRAARAWLTRNADTLWLPVTVVAELAAGIGKREAQGETRHAGELRDWLESLLIHHSARVLTFGLEEASRFRLIARRLSWSGLQVGFADLSIASIALAHGLVISTRNVKHFAPLGVEVVNPFES